MYIWSLFKTPTEKFWRWFRSLLDSPKVQLLERVKNTASRKVTGSKPRGFRKASRKVIPIYQFTLPFAPASFPRVSLSVRKQNGRYPEAILAVNRQFEARGSKWQLTWVFTPPPAPTVYQALWSHSAKNTDSRKVSGSKRLFSRKASRKLTYSNNAIKEFWACFIYIYIYIY